MRKLKTSVIGVGGMGTNHCRVLDKISKLTAVCDKDVSRLAKVQNDFKINTYVSIDEMIEKEKPDAITIAVNTQFHKETSLAVLDYKIPLLIEKPLALNVVEGKKILNSAKRKNVFLMVGMVERYNPTIQKIKNDIQKGLFGEIYQIVAMRVGISPSNMSPRSVDLDLSVHDIDLANYLLDQYPNAVQKSGNAYLENSLFDTCVTTLAYNNATVTIISNWISPVKIRRLYIFGEKLSAEINLLNQKIYYYSKIPLKAITKGNYFRSFQDLGAYSRQIVFQKAEPLREELKVFLKNVDSGYLKEYCENGLEAIRILENSTTK